MKRLYLDTEFTGLHQHTSLISLALYSDDQNYFYAEFNDYHEDEVSDWLEKHVMSKLDHFQVKEYTEKKGNIVKIKSGSNAIAAEMVIWLRQFDAVEIWADVLAYDWVLFCELFGGALYVPDNIYFAPFDLATAFRLKGMIKPTGKYGGDVSRFEMAGVDKEKQHHALEDARVEKICWEKMMGE